CAFFFFQAEDGIRDVHVTGVQTCALPIWLQPLSEFGDDPHLLSTVRFYRYFFGEQLRKLLQMAMGDAVDVRFERRLAGGYGGGASCLYGQGCALPYLTTASNFLR